MTLPASTGLPENPTQSSESKSLVLTANPPFVVPQNVGTLNLQLEGFEPNPPDSIQWLVYRNPPDQPLQGPVPERTINPDDRHQATVATDGANTQGSFNIIAYSAPSPQDTLNDIVKDGIIVVINLVIVKITATGKGDTSLAQFFATSDVLSTQLGSGNQLNPAISFFAGVTLNGGGADGRTGLDKIPEEIDGKDGALGWIGNGAGDSFTVTYPQQKFGIEVLTDPPKTFPILDCSRQPAGKGAASCFRINSKSKQIGTPPGGLTFKVTAYDNPGTARFRNSGPTGDGESTDGTNDFFDYLGCYSTDFPNSYTIAGLISWSADFIFHYDGTSWADNGSKMLGGGDLNITTYPKSAAAANAIVVPPTFFDSAEIVYP